MPTKKILEQGNELQVPSTTFNFLFVVNLTPQSLEVEMTHNDLATPVIVLREVQPITEEDKAINEKLKKYEGVEVGQGKE